MASCDNCKKYPLEFRELNEVEDEKGIDKILCNKCFEIYWRQNEFH